MDLSARLLRIIFPSAIFETTSDNIHLTFDDGPHPTATPAVLEILRKCDIRATFFLTGSRVREFPGLAKNIIADNHTIGNHAYHHNSMLFQPKNESLNDIVNCNAIIRETTGVTPTLFRPPFGYYDFRVAGVVRSLGMRLVHWSHDVRDFRRRTDANSIRRVAENVTKGSILLLHDNDATTSTITSYLPLLIDSLKTRGFSFASLD